jgi:hypothetical protein
MKALCLVSSLLSSLGLRVELFLFCTWLEIHTEVIKLFGPIQELCLILLFILLFFEEVVGPIVEIELYLALLSVFFLIFDGGILAIIFLRNLDIGIIEIDQGSFFVGAEEHVLPIIVDSLEGLDAVVVESRRTNISRACVSCF